MYIHKKGYGVISSVIIIAAIIVAVAFLLIPVIRGNHAVFAEKI